MNSVLPYHRGVLIQKGRGIGGVFNSLFRTLLPIGKAVIKSSPKLIKSTAKTPLGRKIRKSAQKVALNTAKNLLESGDIKKTFKRSIEDSKKEISNALNTTGKTRKRKLNHPPYCKPRKYHFLK